MLKIENLSVAVQGRQILHDINLHIKPGEVHVLFGPNGTGKSTFIKILMGEEKADSGTIDIGETVRYVSVIIRRMAYSSMSR